MNQERCQAGSWRHVHPYRQAALQVGDCFAEAEDSMPPTAFQSGCVTGIFVLAEARLGSLSCTSGDCLLGLLPIQPGQTQYAAPPTILRVPSFTGSHLRDLPQSCLRSCLLHHLQDHPQHTPRHKPPLPPPPHHPQIPDPFATTQNTTHDTTHNTTRNTVYRVSFELICDITGPNTLSLPCIQLDTVSLWS